MIDISGKLLGLEVSWFIFEDVTKTSWLLNSIFADPTSCLGTRSFLMTTLLAEAMSWMALIEADEFSCEADDIFEAATFKLDFSTAADFLSTTSLFREMDSIVIPLGNPLLEARALDTSIPFSGFCLLGLRRDAWVTVTGVFVLTVVWLPTTSWRVSTNRLYSLWSPLLSATCILS